MNVKSGDFDVLNSGSVISYEENPISFNFDDLKITLSFQEDTKDKSNRMDSRANGDKELELILINFNNSLGTGTIKPLNLGTYRHRVLYLNFVVYSIGGKSTQRTVHYTWYLGEEVANG